MKPKNKQIHKKKSLTGWLFLSPSLAGVGLFFIVPFLVVIYYAMVDNPVQHNFVWFKNFASVLKNTAFQDAARNTAAFSVVAVPLAVLLALGLALLLEAKIPFRSHFRTFFLSPMMVPTASIVLIWQVLFHQNGVINQFTEAFGVQAIDWLKSDYNQLVILTLFLWKNLGYNMILFMAALGNIPKELIEVSMLDGAGSWRQFWRIKLHYISPALLFVTILSLINSFKVFREAYLLAGDYPYESLYMLQNFMNNTFRSLDYQKLSSAAILMSIVMVVIIGALFIAENRFGKDVEE
ncbi:MAG: sugar ABC transporter permease [Oscillospiraceae bacterium]|nr:sugar ABC transporter permease [Oscillospiraceae bacterium]